MGVCKDGNVSCSICTHEQRIDIDRAIVAGESQRSIARRFNVSDNSVRWHIKQCMARTDANLITSIAAMKASPAPYQSEANLSDMAACHKATQETYLRIAVKLEGEVDKCISEGDRRNIAACAQVVLRAHAQFQDKTGGNINVQINNDIRNSREWAALMRLTDAHPELQDELLGYLS